MKSREILIFLFVAALSLCSASNAADRPNVIVVITDDQGYGDMSFYGNPILKTPQLDRLAARSIRLDDFHAAPMCAATRGQLMSGLDAARNGTTNVSSGRSLMHPELDTMADIFSKNGYNTGIFGKWHLGDNYPFRPQDRGFQETLWFPASHIGSVPDYWGNDYNDDVYIHNGKRKPYTGYCTDVFFENAIEWMSSSAKKGKPFFTYLPTNTPHWPFIGQEEDIKVIEEAVANFHFDKLPSNKKQGLIGFLAMIRNIDTNIGRMIDFLEEEGLLENTILIFTTDNGSTFGSRYYNAGMRGRKTEMWEGGHRVPCFISWPDGGLGESRDVDGLTQVQDLLPTLVELCYLETAASSRFDGISLAPVIRSDDSNAPDDRMLIVNYSRMPYGFDYPSPASPSVMRAETGSVLWKQWRLLGNQNLYNLGDDPLQQSNIIDEYPEVVQAMRQYRDEWWKGVKDIANRQGRIVIGSDNENPMMITACEWTDVFVDMKHQIEQGVRRNSYWNLDVEESGKYEFELRRWPRESGIAIMDAEGEGTALPITSARLIIGREPSNDVNWERYNEFQGETKTVSSGDQSVVFTAVLEPGPITLSTWFDNADNKTECGAYYVYVNRK